MSLLDNLPDECSIYRKVFSRGRAGGKKESPSLEQSGVECWEQPASVNETMEFLKRGITDVRKIYFSADPSVTEQHEILITKKDGSTVTRQPFEIMTVSGPDASAGLGILWKVMGRYVSGQNQ